MRVRKEGTAVMKVAGLNRAGRAQRLRRAATGLDGVLQFNINYIIDTVTVKFDASKLTSTQVRKKLGLGV